MQDMTDELWLQTYASQSPLHPPFCAYLMKPLPSRSNYPEDSVHKLSEKKDIFGKLDPSIW